MPNPPPRVLVPKPVPRPPPTLAPNPNPPTGFWLKRLPDVDAPKGFAVGAVEGAGAVVAGAPPKIEDPNGFEVVMGAVAVGALFIVDCPNPPNIGVCCCC